jgi:hypothetical protein
MAPMMMRRFARVDDEDVLDDFDPAYFPKRVYKDGRGPRVRLMLTDAAPPALNDAHRPHQVRVVDSAERRLADEAYDAGSRQLENAWRGPSSPPPLVVRDGESTRDAWVRGLSEAWKAPPGRNDPAEASASSASDIEALQRRWASAGATAGPGRRPTQDAGPRPDVDQAYEEYCARLQAAWKTR